MPANTNRRPVQMPLANDTRTVAPTASLDPGGHDIGAGALFDDLARGFDRQASQLGQLADKAAQTEGYESGLTAGMDNEFRPRRDNTIRGNAFDMAGIKTAGNRLRSGMRNDLAAAFEKYGDDPAALKKALSGAAKGYIGQANKIDKRLGADLQGSYSSASHTFMRRATRRQVKRVNAQYLQSTKADLTDRVKTMEQDAYYIGLDPVASDYMASDYSAVQASLQARTVDGKPLFTPKQQQKQLKGLKDNITIARISGTFERLEGLEAKEKFVQDLESQWQDSKGIAASFDRDGLDKLKLRLGKHLKQEQSGRKVAVKALEGQVKKFQKLVESGHNLNVEDMGRFELDWATNADPEVYQKYEKINRLNNFQQSFKMQHPGKMAGMLEQKRAKLAQDTGLGTEERLQLSDELDMGEKILATVRQELKTDPLKWAAKTGRYAIEPLDRQNFQASLENRIATAITIGDDFNITPPYLNPAEKQQMLASAYDGGEQFVALLGNITEAAGSHSQAILAQVFDKSPMLAQLGAMAQNAATPDMVAQIADHIKRRRSGKEYMGAALSQKKAKEFYASSGYESLLRGRGKTQDSIMALAGAIAEISANTTGRTEVDEADFHKAMRIALGEQVINGKTFGGIHTEDGGYLWGKASQTIIPPFVEAKQFRPLVEAMRDEDLTKLGNPKHGNGTAATAAEIKDGQLHYIGDGKYQLETAQGFLAGADGGRWVLDYKAMMQLTSKRQSAGLPLMMPFLPF